MHILQKIPFPSRNSILCLLLLAIMSLTTVIVIPPFQSPDEFAHVYRSYSLSHGIIILDKNHNGASGGYIDKGLLEYMGIFSDIPSKQEQKFTIKKLSQASSTKWKRDYSFVDFSATASYMPLTYLPQTLAFLIGENCNISVEKTYYMARVFSIVSILLILYIAFCICEPHPLVYFLLLMPISMFQISSSVSDGIHFSLCIMIMSLFIKMLNSECSTKVLILQSVLIFVLATHRINFYLMAFLPGILFLRHREKKYLIASVVVLTATTIWILTTMGGHLARSSNSMTNVIFYYLLNPIETITIFFNTFTNFGLLHFYYHSFIGNLGWLDYSIKNMMHILAVIMTFVFIAYSRFKNFNRIEVMNIICAFFIFLSTYFILLVQWTKFPDATVIEGVQGRYLITIVIMISYSFINIKHNKNILLPSLIYIFSACSFISLIKYSLIRYYIG